jgi:hypothetical protein
VGQVHAEHDDDQYAAYDGRAETPMIGDASMHGGMGAIREELDEKGRVVGRIFVPQAVGNGDGISDGMLRIIGEQNKILLQS